MKEVLLISVKGVISKVGDAEFGNVHWLLSQRGLKIFVGSSPRAMHREKEKSHEMLIVWPVAKESCVKYHICVLIYAELDRIRIEI